MKPCRICGIEKDKQDFYKVKHFDLYKKIARVWCRDCQKLYMNMKRTENEKEKFNQKLEQADFILTFS